ncbi:MAG: sigma 54-interacting transcriptional regulator [Candidatus Cloacimonetes bacterium]|nr:sigma 54-interacting transcriptional regulator [Candidatus Cloacimonadota bacterium]
MKKYQIIKKLGKGTFSNVFLVKNNHSELFVKKEFINLTYSEAMREFMFIKQFKDEHIVKAVEFTEKPVPSLILKYIEGDQLKFENLFTEKQKYKILSEITNLIAQIHSTGICINDIKAENIIINRNEPYLIDLGLATVNLFQDEHFRGTLSYAAPEKLLYNKNQFKADIFALGILTIYFMEGFFISDKHSPDSYKNLLSDKNKWKKAISEKLLIDSFIKSMIAFDPSGRPSIQEISDFFCEKAGYSLEKNNTLIIKNHIFPSQLRSAEKLTKNNYLEIHPFDGIEQIINLFSLRVSSYNKLLIILKESDFISQPQQFYKNITSICKKNINNFPSLISFIKKTEKHFFLLIRDIQNYPSDAFEQLTQIETGIFILRIIEQKNIHFVNTNEYISLINLLQTDRVQAKYLFKLYKKMSIFECRKILIEQFSKKVSAVSENILVDFLNFIGTPLPYFFAMKVIDNFNDCFREAVEKYQIIYDGNYLSSLSQNVNKTKISKKIFEKALKFSEEMNLYKISGILAYRNNQKEKALAFWEKEITEYIQKHYYHSALSFLNWLKSKFQNIELSNKLSKKEAFLYRILNQKEEALNIYNELEEKTENIERAIIQVDKAIVLEEMKKFEEALRIYRKATKIFRKNNEIKSLLRAQNNYASVLLKLNKWKKAEQEFLEILNLAEKENDKAYIAIASLNLAEVNQTMGEWKKSLLFARKAAELSAKYNRFQFQILADLMAITCQIALGKSIDFEKILIQLAKHPKLSENPQLENQVIPKIYFLLCLLDSSEKDKIFKLQVHKIQSGNEKELFFQAYQHKYFHKTSIIAEKSSDKILISILKNDTTMIIKHLNKLLRAGDIFQYLELSYFLLYHCNWDDDKLFLNINETLKVHSFLPLENILNSRNKKNKLPVHLPELWETITNIHKQQDYQATLESVLKGLIEIGKLERTIYFHYNNKNIEPILGIDNNLHLLDLNSLRISKTILKETVSESKLKFFTNLQEDIPFDFNSSIFGLGLRTAFCFPVFSNQEIIGVIYADDTNEREFSPDDRQILKTLMIQAQSALERSELIRRVNDNIEISTLEKSQTYGEIIGISKKMREIFLLIQAVGKHNVNVLIEGATGSGKELIARALHRNYAPSKPFIALNCAAIPKDLIESELFGYKKGAFTGASQDKKGTIESANEGTLFLDEISELPYDLQAKILRVIQERKITPLGSSQEIPVNIRVLAATNKNLDKLIETNNFREDLYYRLKVIRISTPSLKERKDDIPLLINYFIEKFNLKFNKKIRGISQQTIKLLQNKDWQGNVRELENEIEKAVLLSNNDILNSEDFEVNSEDLSYSITDHIPIIWSDYKNFRKDFVDRLDQQYVKKLLEKTDNKINKAGLLGKIERKQIYRILDKSKSL